MQARQGAAIKNLNLIATLTRPSAASPRGRGVLTKLSLHPFQFAADIIRRYRRFSNSPAARPTCRFRSRVGETRIRLVKLQSVFNREARRAEWAKIVKEYRHVNVRPPLARTLLFFHAAKASSRFRYMW